MKIKYKNKIINDYYYDISERENKIIETIDCNKIYFVNMYDLENKIISTTIELNEHLYNFENNIEIKNNKLSVYFSNKYKEVGIIIDYTEKTIDIEVKKYDI